MIVVLPESVSQTPVANNKTALKILSRIVTGQIEICRRYRMDKGLKGGPRSRGAIFKQWANIHSRELKSMDGAYADALKELLTHGLIAENPHYSNRLGEEFTKSYRLHKDLWDDELRLSTIKQRRSMKRRTIVRGGKGVFTSSHRLAEEFLDVFYLPDDVGAVSHYEDICKAAKWPDQQRAAVAVLNDRRWWSSVDEYGRYHTPLTNLNKELRLSLLCSGKRIVGFDFANFQPALLAIHPAGVIPEDERDRYATLCRTGWLYEAILKESKYATRNAVKKALLKMLNDKLSPMRKIEVWGAFSKMFPGYAKLIEEIKQTDHTNMANYLQKTEATIMFGEIVDQFCKRAYNHAPFFTCHDCVYTTKEWADQLKRVMADVTTTWRIPAKIKQETTTNQAYSPTTTYVTTKQMVLGLGV